MKVLIVEDNMLLRENIIFLLKKQNIMAEWAWNGQEALLKACEYHYDVIVLDVNMPIMNGKEFLQEYRKKGKSTAIIALTSNGLLEDKIEMFELWVDDYLTKPFETQELLLRIKALTKRSEHIEDDQKEMWDISINYSCSKIYIKGEEVYVPHKQYLIIEYLSKNLWYPKSKVQIMEYVWGEAEENLELDSTTLESHIYALRKKLGKDFIKTLKGVWYIIE